MNVKLSNHGQECSRRRRTRWCLHIGMAASILAFQTHHEHQRPSTSLRGPGPNEEKVSSLSQDIHQQLVLGSSSQEKTRRGRPRTWQKDRHGNSNGRHFSGAQWLRITWRQPPVFVNVTWKTEKNQRQFQEELLFFRKESKQNVTEKVTRLFLQLPSKCLTTMNSSCSQPAISPM